MGFYKQRELYLEGIAEVHPMVLHNQQVTDASTGLRRSFFRINDEDELLAACVNWIHFPCVVMISLSGSLINKSGSIRQNNVNEWWFLEKMNLDAEEPIAAAAITVAYDRSFKVMQDFIKQVWDDYEDNPGCGYFFEVDLGKFKWQQIGPVADLLYGWILTFSDEVRPFDNVQALPERPVTSLVETMSFDHINRLDIAYTTARRNLYGNVPLIEVWLWEPASGNYYKSSSAEVLVDCPPPNQTSYIILPGQDASGFVTISALSTGGASGSTSSGGNIGQFSDSEVTRLKQILGVDNPDN